MHSRNPELLIDLQEFSDDWTLSDDEDIVPVELIPYLPEEMEDQHLNHDNPLQDLKDAQVEHHLPFGMLGFEEFNTENEHDLED